MLGRQNADTVMHSNRILFETNEEVKMHRMIISIRERIRLGGTSLTDRVNRKISSTLSNTFPVILRPISNAGMSISRNQKL